MQSLGPGRLGYRCDLSQSTFLLGACSSLCIEFLGKGLDSGRGFHGLILEFLPLAGYPAKILLQLAYPLDQRSHFSPC